MSLGKVAVHPPVVALCANAAPQSYCAHLVGYCDQSWLASRCRATCGACRPSPLRRISSESCHAASIAGHDAAALELCPPTAFEQALRLISGHLEPATLQQVGGADAVLSNYVSRFGSARCLAEPAPPTWPAFDPLRVRSRTSRATRGAGVLLNSGDGTTGTSGLHCTLQALGAHSTHGGASGPAPKAYLVDFERRRRACGDVLPRAIDNGTLTLEGNGCSSVGSCTDAWHKLGHDAFVDTPVPQQLAALLATLPRGALAGVVHTLRDPPAWRRSRLAHHEKETSCLANLWRIPNAGCVGGTPMSSLGPPSRYGPAGCHSNSRHAPQRAHNDASNGTFKYEPTTASGMASEVYSPLAADRDKLTYDAFAVCLAQHHLRRTHPQERAEESSRPSSRPDEAHEAARQTESPHKALEGHTDADAERHALNEPRLLVLNVFRESNVSVAHRLWKLLRGRGVFAGVNLTEAMVQRAWEHCRRLKPNEKTYQPTLDPYATPPVGHIWTSWGAGR